MKREKIILLSAMGVAVLMILFPPWSVRQRQHTVAFGPEQAGRYAFIASPPNASTGSGWATTTATLDLTRLMLQFVALGFVTGGTIIVLRTTWRKKLTEKQHRLPTGSTASTNSVGADNVQSIAATSVTADADVTRVIAVAEAAEHREADTAQIPAINNIAITPATETPDHGFASATTSAVDEMARRWPWSRVAKWSYNWYLLFWVWTVFGLFWTWGQWDQCQRAKDSGVKFSDIAWMLIVVELIWNLASISTVFIAQMKMRQRIDVAAKIVAWLLVINWFVCIADSIAAEAVLPKGSQTSIGSGIIAYSIRCAILLPLLLPLRNRRFVAFSNILAVWMRDGLPEELAAQARGSLRLKRNGAPVRPHIVWRKLLRAITYEEVTLPEEADVSLRKSAEALIPNHNVQSRAAMPPAPKRGTRNTSAQVVARRMVPRGGLLLVGMAALAGIAFEGAYLLDLFPASIYQRTPAIAAAGETPDNSRPGSIPEERWPRVFEASSNDISAASEDDIASGEKALEQMANASGFYMGQTYSIGVLEEKFPRYFRQLEYARRTFDTRFKGATDNIERILEAKAPGWTQARLQIQQTVEQRLHPESLTDADAKEFLRELKERSDGHLPILATLLTFDPTYMAQPAREFLDGYKQVYRTAGGPTSYGLRLSLEYPQSWRAETPSQQNVIQSFTDEDGRGSTLLVISAGALPETLHATSSLNTEIDRLRKEGFKSIWQGSGARDLKTLDSGFVTLAGHRTAWAESIWNMNRVGIEIQLHGLIFAFADHDCFVYLMFFSGASPGVSKNNADIEFQRHARLFQLMLNSVAVQNEP